MFGILLWAEFLGTIYKRRLQRRVAFWKSFFNTPCRSQPVAVSLVPWKTRQWIVVLFMFVSFFLLMLDKIFQQLIRWPFGNLCCSLYSTTVSKILFLSSLLWPYFHFIDRNLCYSTLYLDFFNISSSQLELTMLLCTLLTITVTADRFVDDVILIIAGRVECELNLSFCQQSTLWWWSIAPRLSEENQTFNSYCAIVALERR